MKRAGRSTTTVCEQQAKFVQERIVTVEKNFAELCNTLGGYTRKTAGVREKNDELVKALRVYSENENVNKTLHSGLIRLAATLSAIGDHRDAEVKRLESKVVGELCQYENICKHAREEVKGTFSAREKELIRKRHLDRVRERNPHNRQMITVAETELLKASAEVSRTVKALEEQVDVFEKKKLQDIKSILTDFVTIELFYHAKAVEMFTQAFQDLKVIDIDDDLEDFRDALRVPDSITRLDTVKRTSFRSSTPLGSIASLFTTPPRFRRSSEAQVERSPSKADDFKSQSVDSLKKSLQNSAESVEIEDFIEDESSYFSEEDRPTKTVQSSA